MYIKWNRNEGYKKWIKIENGILLEEEWLKLEL